MKCTIELCNEEARVLGYSKWLCFNCYNEIKNEIDSENNNRINIAMKYINYKKGEQNASSKDTEN